MSSVVRLGLSIAASGVAAVGCCAGMRSACVLPYSPSHTISCEIDYQRDPGLPDSAYRRVSRPESSQESVHMDPRGTYLVCGGESCLGNPGLGQPRWRTVNPPE